MSGWRSQNGEVTSEIAGTRGRDRADAQRALEPAADLRQLVPEAVVVGQDAMRPEHDALALAREALEALAAPHERHAELGLELAQAGRERRLRDVAGARGAPEVALPLERDEVLELAREHGLSLGAHRACRRASRLRRSRRRCVDRYRRHRTWPWQSRWCSAARRSRSTTT